MRFRNYTSRMQLLIDFNCTVEGTSEKRCDFLHRTTDGPRHSSQVLVVDSTRYSTEKNQGQDGFGLGSMFSFLTSGSKTMSTTDPSPLRRSGRERKKPTSEYDQELEAIAKKKKSKLATENVSS